jgi:regulator of protease activity HflC (stomatin/prohibitin superfamily)
MAPMLMDQSGGGIFGLTRKRIGIAITIVVAFLLVLFPAAPFFTVEQGEAGVVLRFGKVVQVAEPGLHFKVPIVDQVYRMSTRIEKRIYDKVQSYSRDVQEASVRLSVNYHVPIASIGEVYARYGTNYATRVIDPVVPDRFKKVFGQYQAATVVSERVKLGQEIEVAIRESVPDTIVVDTVQFENVDFSANYIKAIEAAAQAEAQTRQSRNELERERVEAQKKVVQAQAQAQQIRERAQADADAIRLRGEAEARAIAAKAKAFVDNPGYSTLVAVERWNGVLPQTMLPGAALPFVTVPQTPPATTTAAAPASR